MTDATVDTVRRSLLSKLGLMGLVAATLIIAPAVIGASKARACDENDEDCKKDGSD